MKTIGEVAKEFDLNENMLRDWEKKGFLGDVLQTDGKRMYDDDQIERIQFIQQEAEDQKTRGWKRTNYKKIQEALTDQFGGMVVVHETRTPEAIGERIAQELRQRDHQIQSLLTEVLDQVRNIPTSTPEGVNPEDFKKLAEVHTKLYERFKEIESEKIELEKELKLEKQFRNDAEKELERLKGELYAKQQAEEEAKNKKSFWQKLRG